MGALEPWHLAVILLIALIVFGPGKVSELGATLGKAVHDFRDATEGKPIPPPAPPRSCAQCAAPLANDAKFCSRCGASTAPALAAPDRTP